MNQTILIVENEPTWRDMLRSCLECAGYRVVETVNGRDAINIARRERSDLVLLNPLLPKLSGFDFLRLFRRESDTPIIVIATTLDKTEEIMVLELGADDYITKPLSKRLVLARVRAKLRRTKGSSAKAEILQVNNVLLDKRSYIAQFGENTIDLTPSEFMILAALMSAPGQVFSRLDLIEYRGRDGTDGCARTIGPKGGIHVTRCKIGAG